MITKNEMINELVRLNIILAIGDKYMLTEKYKDLLSQDSKPVPVLVQEEPKAVLDRDKLLNPTTNGTDWPAELFETKGRERAAILMDLCEIPVKAARGYRLKGLDADAINIIGNMIESDELTPKVMIDSIKNYYETTESPKSFKNYLKDGDFYDVYLEYIDGDYNPLKAGKKWN